MYAFIKEESELTISRIAIENERDPDKTPISIQVTITSTDDADKDFTYEIAYHYDLDGELLYDLIIQELDDPDKYYRGTFSQIKISVNYHNQIDPRMVSPF